MGRLVERAQVFTVGLTGLLAQVDVPVYRESGVDDDLMLEIVTTTGGVPDMGAGAVLGSLDVPQANFGTTTPAPFVSIDVTSLGISVDSGDVLAIVLSSDSTAFYGWRVTDSGGYAGGNAFRFAPGVGDTDWVDDSPRDLGFRTYVEVIPTPAAAGLGLPLLGLLGITRPRRVRAA